jgi:hypothetical protein
MTDRFAIVPCPDGSPLPALAIMIGDLNEVMQFLPHTIAYQQLEQRALGFVDQLDQRERKLSDGARVLTQSVGKFMDACGRLVEDAEARKAEQAQRKAEQAEQEEKQRIEDELAALPDPDAPDDPLGAAGDDDQLSIHPAVDPERYGPGEDDAAGEPVKPVLSYGKVPTSYIKKKDATGDLPEGLEMRAPSPLGTDPIYDPAELGRAKDPKQTPQPIDVSLHEE